MATTAHRFTFLGTGSGCGVPAFFCSCPACEEARHDPRARRGCCGVLIEGEQRLLIDTPPDLRHQLLRENIKTIDKLIYTHAHYDHVSGLGELEYFIRLVLKQALPTSASAEAHASIEAEFGYLDDILVFEELTPFTSFEYDGIRYTALPVTHAPGTFGYLIETPTTRLFYASDTGRLDKAVAQRVHGVDILIMDATFWGDNWSPHAHHSVQETIEESLELEAGTTYLTHLAMHYDTPLTLRELETHLEHYKGRVKVAYDGLILNI